MSTAHSIRPDQAVVCVVCQEVMDAKEDIRVQMPWVFLDARRTRHRVRRERERELEMRLGEYLLLLRLPCKHEFPWPQGAGTLGEPERVGETGAMKCPEPRFHYKCISNWLTKRNTCCICNGPAVLSAPHFT